MKNENTGVLFYSRALVCNGPSSRERSISLLQAELFCVVVAEDGLGGGGAGGEKRSAWYGMENA